MNNNKKEFLQIRITKDLKQKLIYDAVKYRFPSMTSYLEKLIETGLPVSDNLDIRLQLIEKQVEVYGTNLENQNKKIVSLSKDIFKRNYIIYRIVAFLLSRSFFIKPGKVSEDDIEDSNRFIEEQLDKYFEKFENSRQS